jgi:uncharacterized membrane protein
MKELISSLAILLFISFIMYIAASIIAWDLNPGNWHWIIRVPIGIILAYCIYKLIDYWIDEL